MLALRIKLHDIHILPNVQKQVKAIGLKEWADKRKVALKYHKYGNQNRLQHEWQLRAMTSLPYRPCNPLARAGRRVIPRDRHITQGEVCGIIIMEKVNELYRLFSRSAFDNRDDLEY